MTTLPHLIDTKTKFYDYSAKGAFGNQLRVWRTAEDFIDSGYKGNIGLRYSGKQFGAPWIGNKIPDDCAVATREILCEQEGYHKEDYYFCEAAPDSMLTLQGEVQRGLTGLDLRYSTKRYNMRKAFELETKHISGVGALYLLQKHLWPTSYDDLQILLDWFPDHVIEFAAFAVALGSVPGRNTVIWEVRKDGTPPGWYALERACKKL